MKKFKFTLLMALSLLMLSCKKDVAELAKIKTIEVVTITDSTAVVKSELISDGNTTLLNTGIVWSLNSMPTKADNFLFADNYNDISLEISNLTPLTNYYVRAFAENEVGISYGNELQFSTGYTVISNPGQGATDIDGNSYESVILGNGQEWMTENLRTATCSNGTPIPNVQNDDDWENLTTPGWSYYKNNSNYNNPFGKLYNWYAVSTCEVCPTGWRVPTENDWVTLRDYLDPNSYEFGGVNSAGGKMKLEGTQYWQPHNNAATNESGFSAIPSGSRANYGGFSNGSTTYAYYWSSTEDPTSLIGGIGFFLSHSGATLARMGFHKKRGVNIRCIKN